jgi:hypothetical protein
MARRSCSPQTASMSSLLMVTEEGGADRMLGELVRVKA